LWGTSFPYYTTVLVAYMTLEVGVWRTYILSTFTPVPPLSPFIYPVLWPLSGEQSEHATVRTMKENENLEYKRSTSELKEGVISIAAMLNKHGCGELYFGVRNDGIPVGQDVSDKTLRTISQAISSRIEPRVYPIIEVIRLGAKDCVRVEFEGNESPYYAYGRVYTRVGDEDQQLSPKEIERLILDSSEGRTFWDSQPTDTGIDEVIEKELMNFIHRAKEAGRLEIDHANVASTLDKLGLQLEGRLQRACEILFCDDNGLEVQMAVFAGNDKDTFLDIRQENGNLFRILREAERYIKRNIRWRVEFGGLERKEIPEVPFAAMREALVNSFCHRDYKDPKGNEIAIFRDRIEIYNPGKFPEGLTPEDYIIGEERSVLRNPLIANIMYLSKDIEKWGSGLKRIHQECTSNDVEMEFKTLRTGFVTQFKRKPLPGEVLGERLGERLGENEERILSLLFEDPSRSIPVIAETIGISTTAVENNIEKLKRKDLLVREGPARGGRWVVMRYPKKVV
jgi:ATP-dependent DNA helicase RecG